MKFAIKIFKAISDPKMETVAWTFTCSNSGISTALETELKLEKSSAYDVVIIFISSTVLGLERKKRVSIRLNLMIQ